MTDRLAEWAAARSTPYDLPGLPGLLALDAVLAEVAPEERLQAVERGLRWLWAAFADVVTWAVDDDHMRPAALAGRRAHVIHWHALTGYLGGALTVLRLTSEDR